MGLLFFMLKPASPYNSIFKPFAAVKFTRCVCRILSYGRLVLSGWLLHLLSIRWLPFPKEQSVKDGHYKEFVLQAVTRVQMEDVAHPACIASLM
jgi:hypothetical protein